MLYIIGGLFAFAICFIFGVWLFTQSEEKESTWAERLVGFEKQQKKRAIKDDYPPCRVSYDKLDTLKDKTTAEKAKALEKESDELFNELVRLRRKFREAIAENGEVRSTIEQFMLNENNAVKLYERLDQYVEAALRITGEDLDHLPDGDYDILRVPGHYKAAATEHSGTHKTLPHHFTSTTDVALQSFNELLHEFRRFEEHRHNKLLPPNA